MICVSWGCVACAHVATICESDLVTLLPELLSLQVELSTNSILGLEHVLVEELGVHHLAILGIHGLLRTGKVWHGRLVPKLGGSTSAAPVGPNQLLQ
jgi:hypothetical protein